MNPSVSTNPEMKPRADMVARGPRVLRFCTRPSYGAVGFAARDPRHSYATGWTHLIEGPLRARHTRGEREGTRACAGRERCRNPFLSLLHDVFLTPTTSPSHCFAMGPALSPTAWRRGSVSKMCPPLSI